MVSGEFTYEDANGGADSPNGIGSAPDTPAKATSLQPNNGVPKAVDDVLYSDIGVYTLLNRLKQSVASARDFAAFLKRRSSLEEEQATGLKRLARTHLESIRRADMRQGSYAAQLSQVISVHEKMGDHSMQFALSLHQMHEDLTELSNNMERGRKHWKHEGLESEKRASDAEAQMMKAKSRYDGLAEDYDRVRTGDTKGSRRLGLKGPKSAEQQESDIRRKLEHADGDYEERVRQAKSQREQLIGKGRPEAVKALQELIREMDSGLALQLQKFAAFNEKLLLGNGLAVSPMPSGADGVTSSHVSMRELITDIDNEKDFSSYITSHSKGIPPRVSEIKYEQHPTLAPKQQQPTASSRQTSSSMPSQLQGPQQAPQPMPQQPPLLSVITPSNSQPNSMNSRHSAQPTPPYQHSQQQLPPQTYNTSSPYSTQPKTAPPYDPQESAVRDAYAPTPPYPLDRSERTPTFPPAAQPPLSLPISAGPRTTLPSGKSMSPTPYSLPALKPVFGVSLEDLFNRDSTAVPLVVYQCMTAVELFGLDVEGIYRQSGTASAVNNLKQMFDHDAAKLDFRNPAVFNHDINSVAGLLKQFFRDLPEPLVPKAQYADFIEGGRVDDEQQRRDTLHAKINEMPDANYATLRALTLHLYRVMQHEGRNRMGSHNLAICWAPSLMSAHTGPQIADAGLQARVLDSILLHTTSIFDED